MSAPPPPQLPPAKNWLQKADPVTLMLAMALGGVGGGGLGYTTAQTRDYRLDRIEAELVILSSDLREIRDSVITAGADRWTRSDHEGWEERQLEPRLSRLGAQLLELRTNE